MRRPLTSVQRRKIKYHRLLPRIIQDSAGAPSVVELGAGIGEFLGTLKNKRRIAVELFLPYVQFMRERHPELEVVEADARRWIAEQPDSSIDTVMALNLIEHMSKEEGEELLRQCLRVASRRVIVYTPRGFQEQHPEEVLTTFPENPLQEHVSGWVAEDLQAHGLAVLEVVVDGGAGGLYAWRTK